MEEKEITPEESLTIIQQMVEKTKVNYSDDSFYFILWGWLTFLASLGQYLLIPLIQERSALVWWLMPVGGIITILYGFKQGKKQKVRTYVESYVGYVWISMGISFIVVVAAMFSEHAVHLMPTFILLYAIGTFITGCLIQFRPLVIGGIICFGLTLVSFYIDTRNQLLIIALAIFISYLLPGYLLKAKFKSSQHV